MNQINSLAKGFKETGGLHDSAIFKADGTIVSFSARMWEGTTLLTKSSARRH